MRFPILATVLSIVMGGGLAFADETQVAPPMPVEKDVFFDTDSSLLTYANDSDLQKLAEWAKCKKSNVIKLEGHADRRGTVEHNAQLSADRAIAVRDKLIDLGTPRDRIQVTIFGELGER